MNDIVGVAVVLGKDQRFGHFGAARENLREQTVAKSLNDGANLVFGNHIAVELVGRIAEIFIQLLPSNFSGELVAFVNVEAGIHD